MSEISYSTKLNAITFTFLQYCTNQQIKNGKKLTVNYWKVYNFLKNTDDVQPQIQKLYDYALSLYDKVKAGEKRIMSLGDFFKKAEAYRVHLIDEHNKKLAKELMANPIIKTYKPFSLADLDNL